MKLLLIRHGLTAGNLEKRYIGRTDEPLCEAGIRQLKQMHYPECEVLTVSPMRRCTETAKLLFPHQTAHICDDFRECDFGAFEGRNYHELSGEPAYQAWIDSGGTGAFPRGESPAHFRERSCAAFTETVRKFASAKSVAMVVHGGTIMSVLAAFAQPHRDYFDWMTENGRGWLCEYERNIITILEKL